MNSPVYLLAEKSVTLFVLASLAFFLVHFHRGREVKVKSPEVGI